MVQCRTSGLLRLLAGVTLFSAALPTFAQSGFVAPSEVLTGEPFLFTAGGKLSGVVVDVKTIEGEVVASKHTDMLGRVFLPAGLAGGAYLISTGGSSKPLGRISVSNDVFDQFGCESEGLKVAQDTPPIDVTKLGALNGNFPHPNSLSLDDFVSTRAPRIRAATTSLIVFDKPSDVAMQPGEMQIKVRDKETGKYAEGELVLYSAQAKLTQVKVASGAETHLVVTLQPKQMDGDVTASILTGPVTFSNGEGSMSLPATNGTADFRVQSTAGSTGKFDVAWELKPRKYKWHLWEPEKKKYKSHLWTPPTQPNPNPPAESGGDTKALEDDGWVKFVEGEGKDQRTGKKKIVRSSEGFEQEVKVYDDGKTSVMTTTRTGEKRKTVVTDTTTTTTEGRTEVVETMEYGKDDKGEWKPKSGKRETKKIVGGKETVSTETWSPTSGWR